MAEKLTKAAGLVVAGIVLSTGWITATSLMGFGEFARGWGAGAITATCNMLAVATRPPSPSGDHP